MLANHFPVCGIYGIWIIWCNFWDWWLRKWQRQINSCTIWVWCRWFDCFLCPGSWRINSWKSCHEMQRPQTSWSARSTSWRTPLWRLCVCSRRSCWGLWLRFPCQRGKTGDHQSEDGSISEVNLVVNWLCRCSVDSSLSCWGRRGKRSPIMKSEEPSPLWCQTRYGGIS